MNDGCRYEFQLRHFGFSDCPASKFYTFQRSKSRLPYMAYRFCVFAFQLGWLIAGWVQGAESYHLKLSNWSMVYSTIYFAFAWFTATYGLASDRFCGKSPSVPLKYANAAPLSIGLFHTKKEKDWTEVKVDVEPPKRSENLRWFHRVTWVFQTVALGTVLVVTFAYWVAIFPGESPEVRDIHGYAKHAINFVVLLIDCLVVNVPVRLLHAVYTVAASLVYTAVLGITYAISSHGRVYGFLDFEGSLGRTLAILLSTSLALSWILQAVWFGVYRMRRCCFKKHDGSPRAQSPVTSLPSDEIINVDELKVTLPEQ